MSEEKNICTNCEYERKNFYTPCHTCISCWNYFCEDCQSKLIICRDCGKERICENHLKKKKTYCEDCKSFSCCKKVHDKKDCKKN